MSNKLSKKISSKNSKKIEYPEVNTNTPWPSISFPYIEGQPIIVMIAGFPDHCTSGFSEVLNELLLTEKYRIICLCLPDFQSNCEKPKPWVCINLIFNIHHLYHLYHQLFL